MKLISLNVALFERNNDGLSEFVSHNPADFLCLQEVSRRVDSRADEALISKDAIDSVSLDYEYQFFAPVSSFSHFQTTSFHGRDVFKFDYGGFIEAGMYVKSKYPITFGKNVYLQNQYSLITDWSNWPKEEYRSVQVIDIRIDAQKKVRLINYHGFWSKDKQDIPRTKLASESIIKLAKEVTYPVIICGDFNLFPDTESIKILDRQFVNLCEEYEVTTTRPSTNELHSNARNVVDYIFVSKEIKVNNFEVVNCDISDHLPLIVEFDV
jgi:endonuclease/exonuclease/phosphatase family metal-dependent hydrolase